MTSLLVRNPKSANKYFFPLEKCFFFKASLIQGLSLSTASLVLFFKRNRDKQNSLTVLNLVSMLLKTIFATSSRILLFSAWLYVVNNGKFSTMKTLIAYYTTALVLFIYNVLCNTRRPSCSSSFWIGMYKRGQQIFCQLCTSLPQLAQCLNILNWYYYWWLPNKLLWVKVIL